MWFSYGANSYGVKYSESFNPIPLPTLALLMTLVSFCIGSTDIPVHSSRLDQIDFCLHEWKTGTLVSDKLQESSLKTSFSEYLKTVVSWKELNPEVTGKIRQKIFNDL